MIFIAQMVVQTRWLNSKSKSIANGTKITLRQEIERLCEDLDTEPNTTLALQICQRIIKDPVLVWSAVEHIQGYLSSRRATRGMLAIFLVDILASNCGYPMHLAISRSTFLNHLVAPLPADGRDCLLDARHRSIVRLIFKWEIGLCERSEHCGDFGLVRKMAATLRAKNYNWTDLAPISEDELAGFSETDQSKVIRTVEEIERSDRVISEAKLQCLLQRGRPGDLKAANELIKMMMTRYDRDEDHGADRKVLAGLQIVEEQKRLLEQMLWNSDDRQLNDEEQRGTIALLKRELRSHLEDLKKLADSDGLQEDLLAKVLQLHEEIQRLLDCNEFSLLSLTDNTDTVEDSNCLDPHSIGQKQMNFNTSEPDLLGDEFCGSITISESIVDLQTISESSQDSHMQLVFQKGNAEAQVLVTAIKTKSENGATFKHHLVVMNLSSVDIGLVDSSSTPMVIPAGTSHHISDPIKARAMIDLISSSSSLSCSQDHILALSDL